MTELRIFRVSIMGAITGTLVPNYEVRYASTTLEMSQCLAVEDEVFQEMNFLPVRSLYEPYLPQSTIFGAFTDDGSCLGMIRIIDGEPFLPPAFEPSHGVQISRRPEYWIELSLSGKLDEAATLAVPLRYRGSTVLIDLLRFGCRHSRGLTDYRGAVRPNGVRTHLAAILAPGVALGMRSRYWFPFQQVGPQQHYMDGTEFREDIVTAPYVLDLVRWADVVLPNNPAYRDWMLYAPMTDHDHPPVPRLRRDDPLLEDLDLPVSLDDIAREQAGAIA
jgi:hypothetical protein